MVDVDGGSPHSDISAHRSDTLAGEGIESILDVVVGPK